MDSPSLGVPVLLAGALFASACEPLAELRDQLAPARSPHEAYAAALEQSGLAYTALGQEWLRAGEQVLRHPAGATLPLQEEGYFPPERPGAVAYRVAIPRGQRIAVHVSLRPDASGRVFIDVFTSGDSITPPRLLASADSSANALEFEPRRTGDYVIRLQPELLRGGRYTLRVRAAPILAFPVAGAGRRDVQSLFGARRDGGARTHQGVDIFAARGTPVLAAVSGRVTRVQATSLGGRVLWLRDERRGNSLYYAHLDTQYVASGTWVERGDTLGAVGNSGNARNTPPHLHFGIYSRGAGPVDPLPFLHVADTTPEQPSLPSAGLGTMLRLRAAGILQSAPLPRADTLASLEARAPLRVLGGIGGWARVSLPDGRTGYVRASLLVPAHEPLYRRVAPEGLELRDAPLPNAALITALAAGQQLSVLGIYRGFAYVSVDTLRGWVAATTPRS